MTDIRFDSEQIHIKFIINDSSTTFSASQSKIGFSVCKSNIGFVANTHPIVFRTQVGTAGGVKNHPDLNDRNLPDQHPIDSITGLVEILEGLTVAEHTHYVEDILDFTEGVDGNINVAANTAARHAKLHDWNSITDHANMPATFPPSAHSHAHSDITGQTANDHHNQSHDINGPDHSGSLPHASISAIGENDHHSKSHAHNGLDGSGSVSHPDITNRHLPDAHPHSSIYNIGPNDHHNKIHDHADDDGGGLLGLEQARQNGDTMSGDVTMAAGSFNASPEGVQFNTSGDQPTAEVHGQVFWNSDDETFNFVLKNGVVGQAFEEDFIPGQNDTGVPLVNGSLATYVGTIGNSGNIRVAGTVASVAEPPILTIGIVTAEIADGTSGKITVRGKTRGFQTDGANYGEVWTDNNILYKSSTIPGGLTKVPPEAPIPAIPIAVVLSAHATNGTLLVRPTFPVSLVSLTDVNGSPLDTTGLIPVWDNVNKYFDFTFNIEEFAEKINAIQSDTQEPNGFVRNDPDSMGVVTVDEVAMEVSVSVTPGRSEFKFYSNGVRFIKTSTETVGFTDVDDKHYFYFDENGVLQHVTVFDHDFFLKYALVAILYWNSVTGSTVIWANEQHGIQMDGASHRRRHLTEGAAYSPPGLNIEGLVDGSPTYTRTTTGRFFDEDKMHEVDIETTHPFLYKLGATGLWYRTAADNNVGYDGGGNTYVNEWTGVTWQLTPIGATNYVIYHFIATNDNTNTIMKVVGESEHSTKVAARAAIEKEIYDIQFNGLPTPEFIFLYSVIVDANGDVVALSDGSTYVDFRSVVGSGSGGASASSQYHADLLGVGPDDHHDESHTIASHSDTTATGAELDELTDGSVTSLHSHSAGAHTHWKLYSPDGLDIAVATDNGENTFFYGFTHYLGLNPVTDQVSLQLGSGRTGNGATFVDFVSDVTYTDYGLRVIRTGAGTGANSELLHRGSGELALKSSDAGSITLYTAGVKRVTLNNSGGFGLSAGVSITEFSNDTALGGASSSAVPTEYAVKTYADGKFALKNGSNTWTNTTENQEFQNAAGASIANASGANYCAELFQPTSGADAFMALHVSGDFACFFGLDGGINDIAVGGWSMGANSYRIYHEGNKKYAGVESGSINKVASAGTVACQNPPILYDNFHIASVSRIGTGHYRVFFDSGLLNSSQVYSVQATANTGSHAVVTVPNKAQTYFDLYIRGSSHTLIDGISVFVAQTANSVTPGY